MKPLLILPILIPFLTGIILILTQKYRAIQRWLGVLGAAALLIISFMLLNEVSTNGIQAVQIGG